MSWVVTSYLLAETIATVLAGKFGDLFGRKRIFQLSVLIFIVGSFFCGLSQDMAMLIGSRAIQGIGGGGIMVTATALIADVIPLRKRGAYQGAMGAVFGVTTVIGPLLGGFFTDHLSWRWAFYVNVPIAIIVIALAAKTIPEVGERIRRAIDYLGVVFVGLGATGLTLATSWGGTQYAWGSPMIIGLFVGSVIALAIFVFVEIRAEEPILPMRLFRSRVFTVCVTLSFIVGFAMFGSLTFLPTFLQYVEGVSATMSGIRMLPMVIGLLLTSVASGTVVGKTGRYKVFPIAGAAVMTLGLFLLSRMDENTSTLVQSIDMFILGAGIGLIMQVLVLVVQSTADYADLGSATSGVTFFRTLGGSFGASVMGSIFANQLENKLPGAMAEAGIVDPSKIASPTALHSLPEAQQAPIIAAYAHSVSTIFLWAVPIAAVALLLALVLPQVALRGAGTAAPVVYDPGEGFAMPEGGDPDTQLESVIGRIVRAHGPQARARVLAASGSDLDLPSAWGVVGVELRKRLLDRATTQDEVEDRLGIPHGVLTSYYDGLVVDGYLLRDGDLLRPTAEGTRQVSLIATAWRDWLLSEIGDWPAFDGDQAQADHVQKAIRRITRRVMLEQEYDRQAMLEAASV